MEIKLVKSAGFCFGVKRAVELAIEASKKYTDKKIYTLGHIIHNNDVVKNLEERNIFSLTSNDALNIKDSVIILRSHGVEKELLENIKKNNNKIIDAICPFVKKIHRYVDMLMRDKYFTIIVGDKGHPEVKAISSFADKDNTIIVSSCNDKSFLNFLKKPSHKIGVVVQTTQDYKNFEEICKKLLKLKGELRIFNSICDATTKRQKETIEVAKKVDIMIVIGGKHSANTKRLKEICKKIQKETYHIENKSQLNHKWLQRKKIIGITAGASTPSNVIEDVIREIEHLNFKNI